MYQESAIPIQKFILATMCLGLLEVSCLGIDLFIWNTSGYRSPLVAYTGKFSPIHKTNDVESSITVVIVRYLKVVFG